MCNRQSMVTEKNADYSKQDTISGLLILRFDSCESVWQYRGASLVNKLDSISLSMEPAFFSEVYKFNQTRDKWISSSRVFESYILSDKKLIKLYERSSPGMIPMDPAGGLAEWGNLGPTYASVSSNSIFINRDYPEAHRYIVLNATVNVITLSHSMFTYLRRNIERPPSDFFDSVMCYTPDDLTRHIIHSYIDLSDNSDSIISSLNFMRIQDEYIPLVVYL